MLSKALKNSVALVASGLGFSVGHSDLVGKSVRPCPYRTCLRLFNKVELEAGLENDDGKHQSITWKCCSPKTTTVFCVFCYGSQRWLPVKMS